MVMQQKSLRNPACAVSHRTFGCGMLAENRIGGTNVSANEDTPLFLTNRSLSFAPDFTGLQTYSAAVPSTWTPVASVSTLELPQIGLWVGEPGLGSTNSIGQSDNANQQLQADGRSGVSKFDADGCGWTVTTQVDAIAPTLSFRVERAALTVAEAPDFGIFFAIPGDERGALTVTATEPGYLLSQRGSGKDFDATLIVHNGSVSDLGLNEIAIYANGDVLEVTVSFSLPGNA